MNYSFGKVTHTRHNRTQPKYKDTKTQWNHHRIFKIDSDMNNQPHKLMENIYSFICTMQKKFSISVTKVFNLKRIFWNTNQNWTLDISLTKHNIRISKSKFIMVKRLQSAIRYKDRLKDILNYYSIFWYFSKVFFSHLILLFFYFHHSNRTTYIQCWTLSIEHNNLSFHCRL